jgi:hypothetical protein
VLAEVSWRAVGRGGSPEGGGQFHEEVFEALLTGPHGRRLVHSSNLRKIAAFVEQ